MPMAFRPAALPSRYWFHRGIQPQAGCRSHRSRHCQTQNRLSHTYDLTGVLLVYLFARYVVKIYDGQLILLTFGWYGLGRMFIEGLRTDSLYIGNSGIRVSQLLAAIIFIVCAGLLIFFFIKKPTVKLYHKVVVEGEDKKADDTIDFKAIFEKVKKLFAKKNEESSQSDSEDNTENEE